VQAKDDKVTAANSMKPLHLYRKPLLIAAWCATVFSCRPVALADVVVAVSSSASADYVRVRQPDGSFEPETYTFGEGGHMPGPIRDDSMDRLTFLDVARSMAVPLARSNYLPAADKNPEKAKLLIMVYWGTTRGTAGASDSDANQRLQAGQGSSMSPPATPPSAFTAHCSCDATQLDTNISSVVKGANDDQMTGAVAMVAANNKLRRNADSWNASLLGYDLGPVAASGFALRNRRDDLIAEVEDNRDFVVLEVYDFQTLWKQRKHKLLWVARLSVPEGGTNFGKFLPVMLSDASQYLGQDSHGLRHRSLSEGHVEIGELKSLGVVPDK
jgi:hypothetical protein